MITSMTAEMVSAYISGTVLSVRDGVVGIPIASPAQGITSFRLIGFDLAVGGSLTKYRNCDSSTILHIPLTLEAVPLDEFCPPLKENEKPTSSHMQLHKYFGISPDTQLGVQTLATMRLGELYPRDTKVRPSSVRIASVEDDFRNILGGLIEPVKQIIAQCGPNPGCIWQRAWDELIKARLCTPCDWSCGSCEWYDAFCRTKKALCEADLERCRLMRSGCIGVVEAAKAAIEAIFLAWLCSQFGICAAVPANVNMTQKSGCGCDSKNS